MLSHVTRIAPSPTGALHLGNARTFLVNWALAKRKNWRIAFRIEDLDSPRVKPDAARETVETLKWLGLTWDGDPLIQSSDLQPYREAIESLARDGHIFTCDLSRTEIERAASAPHADDGPTPAYPPGLRPGRGDRDRWRFAGETVNHRFAVPDDPLVVPDMVAGTHIINPAGTTGDFVVWTKRGMPAYQLAVVVDDLRQQVTDVVRGDDLLESAALQTLIYRALGHEPPNWWHLPLVVGEDGRRLAKRHGDSRITTYRHAGVAADRIIGLLASWCGVVDRPEPMSADAFALSFSIDRLSRSPITFTQQDHTWLLSDTSPSH